MAVALDAETVRLEDFDAARMNDSASAPAGGLHPSHRRTIMDRHAQSTRGAVALQLKDGRKIECDVAEPLGHPHNPMSEDSIGTQNFSIVFDMPKQPFAADAIQSSATRISDIEGFADMRDLFGALRGARIEGRHCGNTLSRRGNLGRQIQGDRFRSSQ